MAPFNGIHMYNHQLRVLNCFYFNAWAAHDAQFTAGTHTRLQTREPPYLLLVHPLPSLLFLSLVDDNLDSQPSTGVCVHHTPELPGSCTIALPRRF